MFIDDILIARESDRENLKALEEFQTSRESKPSTKVVQGQFLKKSVDFLGHRIDATGIHPLLEKVQAVKDAPAP